MPATPTYCANRSTGLSGAEPLDLRPTGRRRPSWSVAQLPPGMNSGGPNRRMAPECSADLAPSQILNQALPGRPLWVPGTSGTHHRRSGTDRVRRRWVAKGRTMIATPPAHTTLVASQATQSCVHHGKASPTATCPSAYGPVLTATR